MARLSPPAFSFVLAAALVPGVAQTAAPAPSSPLPPMTIACEPMGLDGEITPRPGGQGVPTRGEALQGIEAAWKEFRTALLAGAWERAADAFATEQRVGLRGEDAAYTRLRAALLGEEEYDAVAEVLKHGLGAVLQSDQDEPFDLVLVGIQLPEGARDGALVWEIREALDSRVVISTEVMRFRWEGDRWALLLPWRTACALGVDLPLPPEAGPSEGASVDAARTLVRQAVQALEKERWEELAGLVDPEQRRWVEAERDAGVAGGWDMTYDFHDDGRSDEELEAADGTRLLAWRIESSWLLAFPALLEAEAPRVVGVVGPDVAGDGWGAVLLRVAVEGHDRLEALPVSWRGGVLHLRVSTLLASPPSPLPGG